MFRATIKTYDHSLYSQIIIKKILLFLSCIRTSGKNVNFGDKKLKKSDFYKNNKVIKIDDIDVNKILVSKEKPYGSKIVFKYFIGYNDNDVIKPLCIKLPQMTGYVKSFENNTTMSFKISNKHLLKKYNQIWKKKLKIYWK